MNETLNNSHGIVSLTTTHLNKLMWSHYGDSHKGFCIEFEIDDSNPAFKGKLYKVKYEEEPMIFNQEIMSSPYKERNDFMFKVITTKDKVWEYEDEYRLILDFTGITPEDSTFIPPLYTVILRPKYVFKIIFGYMCDQKYINDVKSWALKCGATHIELFKITLCPEKYELTLKDIA
ncbi:DUF2971 domain-containing protein [Marinomonas primoryensis]|uniref:DUF2971 domain-containing protein n=1 Tax=Marinomonas primoryensis TaxID=178399 RepID=UPI003703FF8A